MEPVVVYKVHSAAGQAVDVLVRAGLHPQVLDRPGPILNYASRGTYRVRVVVPAEEAEQAEQVLSQWMRDAEPTVAELTGRFKRQLIQAAAVAGVTAVVLRLFCESWGQVPWVVVGGVGFADLGGFLPGFLRLRFQYLRQHRIDRQD